MFSYFNGGQNTVEKNFNHIASGSSSTSPTKKESSLQSQCNSVPSYNSSSSNSEIDKEKQGFLSGYQHDGKNRSVAEINNSIYRKHLPYHSRNNSDSNSSTEDSHIRRVALMMVSPARSPQSNSSREKQRRRTRPPSRRTSGANSSPSQPSPIEGYSKSTDNDKMQSPLTTRRRLYKSLPTIATPSHKRRLYSEKSQLSEYSSTELSSESSPDTSPSRLISDMCRLQHDSPSLMGHQRSNSRQSLSSKRRSRSSNISISSLTDSYDPKSSNRKSPAKKLPSRDSKSIKTKSTSCKGCSLARSFLGIVLMSLFGTVVLTRRAIPASLSDKYFDENLFNAPNDSGLRRKQVLGGLLDTSGTAGSQKSVGSKRKNKNSEVKRTRYSSLSANGAIGKSSQSETMKTSTGGTTMLPHILQMRMPPSVSSKKMGRKFDNIDQNIYFLSKNSRDTKENDSHPRTVMFDPTIQRVSRKIKIYPADFSDNTQLYGILPSDDERLNRMEIREPYSYNECVPMQEWQTTFQPSCNGMHELALQTLGASTGELEGLNATLFGTKGFWRYAWKLVIGHHDHRRAEEDTIVFKNLKYEHNFEDAHFEHDRVDAVAMERLTSSPHVINIFGFCGHSVMTEYADGKRLGRLADKSKKIPLKRLEIARDIATGLADVHGIDGDGNNTFVHLDVNPANVVSVNGTLKLNDFNIGIIRRWNTTSNEPCGFPAQYPNPQWRSPEESRNELHLTEKVDVFSLGHIFFRLICGHEPWNKLEPGGKPTKDEIDKNVQRGDLPFIPDTVSNSVDPEVVAIREIMLKCYSFDPIKRPSARYVANALDLAFNNLKQKYSSQAPKDKKNKKKAKAKSSPVFESLK